MIWFAAPLALALTSAQVDTTAQALKETELTVVEHEGFYNVSFAVSKDRKQTATIRKEVFTFLSLAYRETFSICYNDKEAPSAELLLKAFQTPFTYGGLVLEKPSTSQVNWRIRYKCELPTQISALDLRRRLELVARTGDAMQKELNPGKEDQN